MRTFGTMKKVSGFNTVSVDKMFAISGGSLTVFGQRTYGDFRYGYFTRKQVEYACTGIDSRGNSYTYYKSKTVNDKFVWFSYYASQVYC